jgi:hypothetical protein
MASETKYNTSLGDLQSALTRFKSGQKDYDELVSTREQVFALYRPIFSPEHIPSLTSDEFKSFLYPKNNHHWTSLYRPGLGVASDIDKLRAALAVLLNENRPIRERFPEALRMVTGFGKAIATAILTVAYPDKYGVWNGVSEAALRRLGLWPGGRYEEINTVLLRLSSDLKIDLWTLDGLMWWYRSQRPVNRPPEEIIEGSTFPEGGVDRILVNRYERDPKARNACIDHYGAVCVVCKFDFGVLYGELLRGFIHVHHLQPLASVGPDYRVDPIKDLRPVCPNCHAVLHRREPPYSLDEVRELIDNAGRTALT